MERLFSDRTYLAAPHLGNGAQDKIAINISARFFIPFLPLCQSFTDVVTRSGASRAAGTTRID